MVPNTTCTPWVAAASAMAADRIEGRRHAPRAGIGFRETDEIGALVGGVLDRAHGVGDIALIFAGTVRNRLHNGDAEGHCGLLIALFPINSGASSWWRIEAAAFNKVKSRLDLGNA